MQGGDAPGTAGVRGRYGGLVERVVQAFLLRGYRIVDYTDVRGCVDFVAKAESSVYVVRVLSNVDALRDDSVREFVRLAAAVNGIPIVVGERTKRDVLEDGVVYRRYGVSVVTLATLEHILEGDLPVYEEFKGKRVVYFDPDAFRSARESLGLSQNELAVEVGTTKDSIYRYEHGYPASEQTARKITRILGEQVIAPVGVGYRGEVGSKEIFQFRRAPWDIFVSSRGKLAVSTARGVVQRKIEILKRGLGVIHDYYALLVSHERQVSQNVPTITEEDIRESKKPEEILRKVRDEFDEL